MIRAARRSPTSTAPSRPSSVGRKLRSPFVIERGKLMDTFVVDECRIELRRRVGRVAIDGEIVEMDSPLEYKIHRDALRLVVPAEAASAA